MYFPFCLLSPYQVVLKTYRLEHLYQLRPGGALQQFLRGHNVLHSATVWPHYHLEHLYQHMIAMLTEQGYAVRQAITTTTRTPRATEKDGKDYHFISPADFIRLSNERYFLETTEYDGHFYGTDKTILDQLAQGTSVIITTDQAGAYALKQIISPCVAISLSVKDPHILAERMKMRGMQSDEQIKKRLLLAQQELDRAQKNPLFDYHIINDDFAKTAHQLITIFIHHAGEAVV